MKNLFILLAAIVSLQLNAQKFSVGAGASVAIPFGKFGSNDITDPEALFIGTGVGFNVNLAYSFNNFIGISLKYGQNENRVQTEDYSRKLNYNNQLYPTIESQQNYLLKYFSIGPKFNLQLNPKLSIKLKPALGYCEGTRANYAFHRYFTNESKEIHSARTDFLLYEFEGGLVFNAAKPISIYLGFNLQYSLLIYENVPITINSSTSNYQTLDSFLDQYLMFSPQFGLNYNF